MSSTNGDGQQEEKKSKRRGRKPKQEEGAAADEEAGGNGEKGSDQPEEKEEAPAEKSFFADFMEKLEEEKAKLKEELAKEQAEADAAKKPKGEPAGKGKGEPAGTDGKQTPEETDGATEAAAAASSGGFFSKILEKADAVKDEIAKSEAAKVASEAADGLKKGASDAAKGAGDAVKDSGVGNSDAAKGISEVVKEVTVEFTDTEGGRRSEPYQSPTDRRRAAQSSRKKVDLDNIEANDDASEVVMHKSSAWETEWKNLTENSEFGAKMSDMRIKFEESENIVVRMVRAGIDKVAEATGGGGDNETALAMEEVYLLEPTFDVEEFLTQTERVMIPAVLEAYYAGDIDVLEEWCTEARYTVYKQEMEMRQHAGEVYEFKILDVESTELFQARMADDNPVFMITFSTYQNVTLRDRKGEIIEGGPQDLKKVMWLIALKRNNEELDPDRAWEVADLAPQHSVDAH